MGSVRVNGFDDVIKLLDKLSNKAKVDDIAKKAVDAAKDKVASSMRASLAMSEHGLKSTGSVSASVQPTEAKVNSYGVYSVAKPTGTHPSGRRNGAVAAYLEYGASNLGARPWRFRAVSAAEPGCIKIIEEYVKSEMGAE